MAKTERINMRDTELEEKFVDSDSGEPKCVDAGDSDSRLQFLGKVSKVII